MPSLTQHSGSSSGPWKVPGPQAPTVEEFQRRIRLFVGEGQYTESDIVALSPIKISENLFSQMVGFMLKLYAPDDCINLVWEFTRDEHGKAAPHGYGKTQSQAEWLGQDFYDSHEVPQSEAGAWIRMNPISRRGISSKDVKAYRFTLVEFDFLPVAEQLAFFARIKLPIAALVLSGGRSVHAWVRVEAQDSRTYAERVRAIFKSLSVFGIDPANKNANRLARLPGAVRTIGAVGEGIQKLLYLNPDPSSEGLTEHPGGPNAE